MTKKLATKTDDHYFDIRGDLDRGCKRFGLGWFCRWVGRVTLSSIPYFDFIGFLQDYGSTKQFIVLLFSQKSNQIKNRFEDKANQLQMLVLPRVQSTLRKLSAGITLLATC